MNKKKQILLHCDKDFFYKMSRDKTRREEKLGKKISWSDYVKVLFGFRQ